LRSFVSKRGRYVEVAESAVLQSKSFTEQRHWIRSSIDVIAPDERELLTSWMAAPLHGLTAKQSRSIHPANHRPFEMTLKQKILGS